MALTPKQDLSGGDLPAQIQGNMIAYMQLFAGLPGIVTQDDDHTFWIVSHRDAPGDNILRAFWPDQEVEKRIDLLFERIGQQIDHIDWFLFPGDSPQDLGKRLEARGMPGGPAGNWLFADLTSIDFKHPAVPVPGLFHVERVRNDAMMKEWVRVSEVGFTVDLPWYYDAYSRHGYGPHAFSLHYIGYLGDTPVTSGTLLDAGGCASIYDVSTPPAFRRQGLGGALTHFLMGEIYRRGYKTTWIWSSNMARSVYQKLGYIDVDFGIREHQWKK